MDQITYNPQEDRLVDPPIDRDAIALLSDLPDAAARVAEMGERDYRAQNASVLAGFSQIDTRQQELEAAEAEFQHFRRLRDSTSVGHVRTTHADTKGLLYPTLYVLTALAALSACWQTAQWIKQAEVFEGLGPVGALFMTGIVISGGVGVPLAWYSLFETDSDRKQFFSLIMKTSAVSVAVWIAMFVLVAWSEDRVFFLMNNGTIGSWFSIATLGSFASFGKALMLPAGILAECTASVAIKLGISRMQDQRSTKEFVSSPHREALSKLAAEAERKVIQRREEVAKLVATRESFDLGLKVFIASCQAEHRLHIDGLEADQLAFRTNRIRNKGGK